MREPTDPVTKDIKTLVAMGPSRVVLLEALEQMVMTFEQCIRVMPPAIAEDATEVVLRNRALIAHYRTDIGSWKELDALLNAIRKMAASDDGGHPWREMSRIFGAYTKFCKKGAGMNL